MTSQIQVKAESARLQAIEIIDYSGIHFSIFAETTRTHFVLNGMPQARCTNDWRGLAGKCLSGLLSCYSRGKFKQGATHEVDSLRGCCIAAGTVA